MGVDGVAIRICPLFSPSAEEVVPIDCMGGGLSVAKVMIPDSCDREIVFPKSGVLFPTSPPDPLENILGGDAGGVSILLLFVVVLDMFC